MLADLLRRREVSLDEINSEFLRRIPSQPHRQHRGSIAGVVEGEDATQAGHQLSKDLEPFRREIGVDVVDAREPSTRSRHAVDQPERDGITGYREYDGHIDGGTLAARATEVAKAT